MTTNQRLRYIVISDLHLGEEESLLTPPKGKSYSLVEAFSDCLADLVFNFNKEKELPVFIFNGDILGLSFSTYHESLKAFEHFAKAITVQNKICDSVVYIPGNHDHHIWQLAQEEEYQKRLSKRKKGAPIPEMISSTSPLYQDGFASSFFEAFMSNNQEAAPSEFKIHYPNFLLPSPKSGDPFVLFHHGHFAENTYHFISKAMQALYPELKTPDTLNALEMQNGAWIDFAFSQLGRSGEAGKYFERLMLTLSSEELLKERKNALAENVAKELNFPYLPFDWMEKILAKRLITNISEKVRSERYRGGTSCSDETMQGLMEYLNLYCHEILKENGWKNEQLTFVWSHTHKPFEKIKKTKKIGQVNMINTGGWTIPPATSPTHGASIILINKKNEVQALRIFMDTEDGEKGVFKVSQPEGETESDFIKSIHDKIYDKENKLIPVWAKFKKELETEISRRRNKSA